MKFKNIPRDYLPIILDRLTRFEPAYIRYKRVFDDVINKFGIGFKLNSLALDEQILIVEDIFTNSFGEEITAENNNLLNAYLIELEKKYFKFNEVSYQYLSTRINISKLLGKVNDISKLTKNAFWISEFNNVETFTKIREDKELLYPIEKIIICEGQTEFNLLSSILKLFGVNLDKLGYLIIQAGGKNQVARKFYSMLEYVNLPFFILLDKDAQEIKRLVEPKLRNIDKSYILNSGEFEDLIPKNVLLKAINCIHEFDFNCIYDDFDDNVSMVKNLEYVHKKYGFGEFKKARFSLMLKEYIENNCTKDDFIGSEINDIIKALL